MADYKFGDGLKTIFLAGVGAIATTAEKSSEIIQELVKKGELTVEQGKELNKDMQQNFKAKMAERGVNIDEITQKITKMSTDELSKLKETIETAEKSLTERMKKAAEAAEEAAEEVAEAAEELCDKAQEAVGGAAEEAAECKEEVCEKAEETAQEAEEAAEEAVEEIKETVEE